MGLGGGLPDAEVAGIPAAGVKAKGVSEKGLLEKNAAAEKAVVVEKVKRRVLGPGEAAPAAADPRWFYVDGKPLGVEITTDTLSCAAAGCGVPPFPDVASFRCMAPPPVTRKRCRMPWSASERVI